MFVEEIKQIEREYRELGRKTREEIQELKKYMRDLNHEFGRNCFGVELDPNVCDRILERWERFTGDVAVKKK